MLRNTWTLRSWGCPVNCRAAFLMHHRDFLPSYLFWDLQQREHLIAWREQITAHPIHQFSYIKPVRLSMISSDCHKLRPLFSSGKEEKFCIIEILFSREGEFKIHFKITCTQSIQSPLLEITPFQNKNTKVISVLITMLRLKIIKACYLDPCKNMTHQLMRAVSNTIFCCFLRYGNKELPVQLNLQHFFSHFC